MTTMNDRKAYSYYVGLCAASGINPLSFQEWKVLIDATGKEVDVVLAEHDQGYDVNVYESGSEEHIDELEQSFQTKEAAEAYVSELQRRSDLKVYIW